MTTPDQQPEAQESAAIPRLDILRFQDLVDEAKRRLPQLMEATAGRSVQAWTDHNVSDPGITLLEACAETTDQLSYRLDRMPTPIRDALLKLIAPPVQNARPATTMLRFYRAPGTPSKIQTVPKDTQVQPSETSGLAQVVFSTTADVALPQDNYAAYLYGRLDAPDIDASKPIVLDPGAPLKAAVDGRSAGDHLIILVKHPGAFKRLGVSLHLQHGDAPTARLRPHWEIATQQSWQRLETLSDLSLQAFEHPVDIGFLAGERKVYDKINAKAGEASLTGDGYLALRLTLHSDEPATWKVATLYPLAAAAEPVPATQVGVGNANRLFTLSSSPQGAVLPSDVVVHPDFPLYVTGQDGDAWSEVDSFAASEPEDRHYRVVSSLVGPPALELNPQAPFAGAETLTVAAGTTAGAQGNVAAGTLTHIKNLPSTDARILVTNPIPATGGSERETLDSLVTRSLLEPPTPSRAVIAGDYEPLLLNHVSGLGRAICLVPRSAGDHDLDILLLPQIPAGAPLTLAALTPSKDIYQQAQNRLERIRPLGSRIQVGQPRYVQLSVKATALSDSVSTQQQAEDLHHVLDGQLQQYLHPLTGGPDGTGWKTGQLPEGGELTSHLDDAEGLRSITCTADYRGKDLADAAFWLPLLSAFDLSVNGFEVKRSSTFENSQRRTVFRIGACEPGRIWTIATNYKYQGHPEGDLNLKWNTRTDKTTPGTPVVLEAESMDANLNMQGALRFEQKESEAWITVRWDNPPVGPNNFYIATSQDTVYAKLPVDGKDVHGAEQRVDDMTHGSGHAEVSLGLGVTRPRRFLMKIKDPTLNAWSLSYEGPVNGSWAQNPQQIAVTAGKSSGAVIESHVLDYSKPHTAQFTAKAQGDKKKDVTFTIKADTSATAPGVNTYTVTVTGNLSVTVGGQTVDATTGTAAIVRKPNEAGGGDYPEIDVTVEKAPARTLEVDFTNATGHALTRKAFTPPGDTDHTWSTPPTDKIPAGQQGRMAYQSTVLGGATEGSVTYEAAVGSQPHPLALSFKSEGFSTQTAYTVQGLDAGFKLTLTGSNNQTVALTKDKVSCTSNDLGLGTLSAQKLTAKLEVVPLSSFTLNVTNDSTYQLQPKQMKAASGSSWASFDTGPIASHNARPFIATTNSLTDGPGVTAQFTFEGSTGKTVIVDWAGKPAGPNQLQVTASKGTFYTVGEARYEGTDSATTIPPDKIKAGAGTANHVELPLTVGVHVQRTVTFELTNPSRYPLTISQRAGTNARWVNPPAEIPAKTGTKVALIAEYTAFAGEFTAGLDFTLKRAQPDGAPKEAMHLVWTASETPGAAGTLRAWTSTAVSGTIGTVKMSHADNGTVDLQAAGLQGTAITKTPVFNAVFGITPPREATITLHNTSGFAANVAPVVLNGVWDGAPATTLAAGASATFHALSDSFEESLEATFPVTFQSADGVPHKYSIHWSTVPASKGTTNVCDVTVSKGLTLALLGGALLPLTPDAVTALAVATTWNAETAKSTIPAVGFDLGCVPPHSLTVSLANNSTFGLEPTACTAEKDGSWNPAHKTLPPKTKTEPSPKATVKAFTPDMTAKFGYAVDKDKAKNFEITWHAEQSGTPTCTIKTGKGVSIRIGDQVFQPETTTAVSAENVKKLIGGS